MTASVLTNEAAKEFVLLAEKPETPLVIRASTDTIKWIDKAKSKLMVKILAVFQAIVMTVLPFLWAVKGMRDSFKAHWHGICSTVKTAVSEVQVKAANLYTDLKAKAEPVQELLRSPEQPLSAADQAVFEQLAGQFRLQSTLNVNELKLTDYPSTGDRRQRYELEQSVLEELIQDGTEAFGRLAEEKRQDATARQDRLVVVRQTIAEKMGELERLDDKIHERYTHNKLSLPSHWNKRMQLVEELTRLYAEQNAAPTREQVVLTIINDNTFGELADELAEVKRILTDGLREEDEEEEEASDLASVQRLEGQISAQVRERHTAKCVSGECEHARRRLKAVVRA